MKETLEEAAKRYIENVMRFSFTSLETKTQANRMLKCSEFGAKWQQENYGLMEIELKHTKTLLASCEKALEERDMQQERMYSEEEVIAFAQWMYDYKGDINKVEELFEQFKKKQQ